MLRTWVVEAAGSTSSGISSRPSSKGAEVKSAAFRGKQLASAELPTLLRDAAQGELVVQKLS